MDRLEWTKTWFELALRLSTSEVGLTKEQIRQNLGEVSGKTAERHIKLIERAFGAQKVPNSSPARWRIDVPLASYVVIPTVEEVAELEKARAAQESQGQVASARTLGLLTQKLISALTRKGQRQLDTDVEVLAQAESIGVQPGPRPGADYQAISTIRLAVLRLKTLRFAYEGGSRPGAVREVIPYGILFGRSNYLVGAEIGSDEIKNFRLDRVHNLSATEVIGGAPEDFNIRDYAAQSFGFFHDTPEDVVLRFKPLAAIDAKRWRFHPGQELEDQPDGSVLVRFRSSGMTELAWHLFTWRDTVEILGPARLKTELVDLLQEALASHQAGA